MTPNKAASIRHWIKNMGFKLFKSHDLDKHSRKIKYYTLGSFGIYDELQVSKSDHKKIANQKFISWTPWGIDLEINSVRDLSKAYADFLKYNPEMVLN